MKSLLRGALAALVIAWMAPAAAADKAPALPVTFGGPFELVDHHGRQVSEKSYAGKFMLIYFGYTFCPDICPTSLNGIAEAMDGLGDLGRHVQPLFVSVDPARDTPAVLKEYAAHFHPAIVGLGGSEAQVAKAAKTFRIHRSKVKLEDQSADEYYVNHSSIHFLMGPDGEFVTLFPHGADPAFMADTMKKYITQALETSKSG